MRSETRLNHSISLIAFFPKWDPSNLSHLCGWADEFGSLWGGKLYIHVFQIAIFQMLLLCNCWLRAASSNLCRAGGSHPRCQTGLHKSNTCTQLCSKTMRRWCEGALKLTAGLATRCQSFQSRPASCQKRSPITPMDVCLWVCAFCGAVHNPCAVQNGGCMHECRVDGGRAHCDCKAGYILAEDRKTCEGKCSS